MTSPSDPQILVVTTHYPFGTIEENWIALEISEIASRFSKVYVLPVKELPGRRPLPDNVELLAPLASCDRVAFFLRHSVLPSTLAHFLSAFFDLIRGPGLNFSRLALILKFACYRSAFERSPNLRRFLAESAPRIVYAYWGHIPALAIPTARRSDARTCVRYHASDLYVERPEVGGFYPWREEVREATDLNAFVSEHGLAYANEQLNGRRPGVSRVYRLGCQNFGPPAPRPSHRVAADPIILCSASWIHPVKRVELIADLAAELSRYRPVVWHHFGGGATEAASAASARASAKGVDVNLHGMVPNQELQRFYRDNQVSFFVNLSRDEGIPVSVMEALNADVPVVATDVGGTSEVVMDGLSGILVSAHLPGGTTALAERVFAALQDGGDLDAARPREVWSKRCDGRQLARKFCDDLLALTGEEIG